MKNQKRFKTFVELGNLIPIGTKQNFTVSLEEREYYISLLTWPAQEYLRRTGKDPLFRGVKLVINEKR